MNYFVTLNGETKASGINRDSAIKKGLDLLKSNSKLGTLNIGIGKEKIIKGKKVYTLLPLHYFL